MNMVNETLMSARIRTAVCWRKMWKLLFAIGCLAFSSGTTYCAFCLIKIQHAGVLPSWVVPFMGLTFITSVVLSVLFVGWYFFSEPMTPANLPSGRCSRPDGGLR